MTSCCLLSNIQHKDGKPFRVYEDPAVPPTPSTSTPTKVDRGVQCESHDGACFCSCHAKKTPDSHPERTAEEEAYELMVQGLSLLPAESLHCWLILSHFVLYLPHLEEVTEEYWKLLAEQRREALDETLEENMQVSLHTCALT